MRKVKILERLILLRVLAKSYQDSLQFQNVHVQQEIRLDPRHRLMISLEFDVDCNCS